MVGVEGCDLIDREGVAGRVGAVKEGSTVELETAIHEEVPAALCGGEVGEG